MPKTQLSDQSIRPPGSKLLHAIDRITARPLVASIVVSADVAWVLVSVFIGFNSRLETIFQTLVAAITLAMVFVIQHTQAREQHVTQRKLDELLAALPHADSTLIALETAADTELDAVHQHHLALRNDTQEQADD